TRAQPARQPPACPRAACTAHDVFGPCPRAQQPADERAAHVAGPENAQADVGHGVVIVARAPKSAVPMRTTVAPSSIGASKSPLIPTESVSRPAPAGFSSSLRARSC